ncbi:MAG: hypothetical protein OEV92_13320 [Nitrospinota bacterium]|nr:hypothetical protein [Nitrospinota bacterium]
MNKINIIAILALITLSFSSGAKAQQHMHETHAHDAPAAVSAPSGKIDLSPELRELLSQEMLAISEGMKELAPAIAMGDGAKAAQIGKKMKASYILAQKLDKAKMEELHKALPADFVDMDHEFHDFAGMLAGAAESGQWNVVPYLFYRLTEGCVNCHGAYAHEKFPTLAGKGTSHKAMAPMGKGGHMQMMGDHAMPMHGKDGKAMDCPMMKEDCAAMKKGMAGAHMHGAKDCMMGDKQCPMDEKGNCIMDECNMAKQGDCPMMQKAPQGNQEEKAPAAK